MSCSQPEPTRVESFAPLAEEFVYSSLALSPISATAIGYHSHQGRQLDELLDDYSEQAIQSSRRFYTEFQKRLAGLRPTDFTEEDRADFGIVRDQVELALLEFDQIQNYRHNPTVYVEAIGNALFTPLTIEYASKTDRMRHILARLKRVPDLAAQAKTNLAECPEIWIRVALAENDGNLGLIDREIRAQVPADLKADFEAAAKPALESLRDLSRHLKALKPGGDWRLGEERYARKFRLALGTDRTPQQVLQEAESDVQRVHKRMQELAVPLFPKYLPGQNPSSEVKRNVRAILDKIAERHATPQTYKADAMRDLEEARQFVRQSNLLPLPPRDNLQVIDTPEFMRGIYAVGGFSSAPALEPHLGAFYWLTPIPSSWPRERVESKLREYNFYKLKLLTIHEAIPGHYVQLEYANDVQPKSRRVLRSVYGNGPYIEGWAQYATEAMLDLGYLDNSPELRLTFLKEELRVLANAIIDIRLQTMQMTDQQAVDFMINDTFQEREEATAKLQRAKLSSAQLPTYLVGWRDWIRVRDEVKSRQGANFKPPEFHRRALSEGAVPLPALRQLMLTSQP